MLQNGYHFYIFVFCINYQSNNNKRNFDKNNHEKQNLKLNTIKTVYDFETLQSRKSTYLIFIYQTQNIKINLKKLEKMKKLS